MKKYKRELFIYLIILIVSMTFPIITAIQRAFNTGDFLWSYVFDKWLTMLPFVVFLLIYILFLLPLLFNKKRRGIFFILTVLLLMTFYVYISNYHKNHLPRHFLDHPKAEMQHRIHRPKQSIRLSGPVLTDTIIALLLLGSSVSIRLIFKHFEDSEKMEKLEKAQIRQELAQLRAQVSPHFFMNSLNNIHGMVETDPQKAQDMILELSGMMRYVLYESSSAMISLSQEVEFLSNYIALMKVRYPQERVMIECKLPNRSDLSQISIPPLVLIIFIENAFKHGVDYSTQSYVNIDISLDGDKLHLYCENSLHEKDSVAVVGGVGLANIRKRLDLLYGEAYTLDISQNEKKYIVTLTIPTRDENQMFSSR